MHELVAFRSELGRILEHGSELRIRRVIVQEAMESLPDRQLRYMQSLPLVPSPPAQPTIWFSGFAC
jgi:hypothetical protein